MVEEWRDIKGYEGIYQVSNYGIIKSISNNKSRKEKILKFKKYTNKYNYTQVRVQLSINGKQKTFILARLVAFAFPEICGEYFEGAEANHKDENPENNCAWNIEWCNSKYNSNYGTRNKRIALNNSKKVLQYGLNGVLIHEYNSICEIERLKGYSHSSIHRAIHSKKPYNSFLWKYKGES